MAPKTESIAPGFDVRLRNERKRLDMTQADFAAMGGVQRLAQGQYEAGSRIPNLNYLAAIAAGGVNLYYLLFDKTPIGNNLSPDQQKEIEKKVFDLIDEFVKLNCGGTLSSDGRFVLFQLWRATLIQAVQKDGRVEFTLADLTAAGG